MSQMCHQGSQGEPVHWSWPRSTPGRCLRPVWPTTRNPSTRRAHSDLTMMFTSMGLFENQGGAKKNYCPSLGWYSHFFGKPRMSSNVCSWFFSKSWQASKHVKFVQADMGGQDLSFDDQYWSCGVRLLVTTCAGWPVVQCCAKPFSLRCFEIQWHLKRCGPDWTDQALRHFHDP